MSKYVAEEWFIMINTYGYASFAAIYETTLKSV